MRLTPVLIGCVVLFGLGCGKGSPVPGILPAPDYSKVEPAFIMNVDDIVVGCRHEQGGLAYNGKIIDVMGEAWKVGRDKDRNPYVSIKIQGQKAGLICFTVEREPWTKITYAQFVRFRGKCHCADGNVYFSNCAIVELSPYNVVRITAAELAREFAADSTETIFKYHDKHMIMTGEVVSKSSDANGAGTLALKSGAAVRIKGQFTTIEAGSLSPLKAGDTATVFGFFFENGSQSQTLRLRECILLEK